MKFKLIPIIGAALLLSTIASSEEKKSLNFTVCMKGEKLDEMFEDRVFRLEYELDLERNMLILRNEDAVYKETSERVTDATFYNITEEYPIQSVMTIDGASFAKAMNNNYKVDNNSINFNVPYYFPGPEKLKVGDIVIHTARKSSFGRTFSHDFKIRYTREGIELVRGNYPSEINREKDCPAKIRTKHEKLF